MTAVQWAKEDACRVITDRGNLAAFVNSADPYWPQRDVQVYIPSICLLAMFTPDGNAWRCGSWLLVPAEPGAGRPEGVRPDAAEWIALFNAESRASSVFSRQGRRPDDEPAVPATQPAGVRSRRKEKHSEVLVRRARAGQAGPGTPR